MRRSIHSLSAIPPKNISTSVVHAVEPGPAAEDKRGLFQSVIFPMKSGELPARGADRRTVLRRSRIPAWLSCSESPGRTDDDAPMLLDPKNVIDPAAVDGSHVRDGIPHGQATNPLVVSVDLRLNELTRILQSASGSGSLVSAELLPLVYDELRNLAKIRMSKEAPGQTLQATALVHEAWIQLSGNEERSWNDRGHFFQAAAQAMRHILVDRARAKASLKRGGNVEMFDIDIHGLDVEDTTPDERVLLVDDMMSRMEQEEPDSARLISLRFFGGLTTREIAAMDEVVERTVDRRLAYAKALLYEMIREERRKQADDDSVR